MKRLESLDSLAFTRMSVRDFPLRYSVVAVGSVSSAMSISFKLGNAGWYCVTKGRIFFRAVLFLF